MNQQTHEMITTSHPWHGVPVGKLAPRIVNAIIEIPQGSRAKYEIDKESGLLRLDRVIYSSFYYPCNYGFIPQTYGGDKDPLDILVITSQPVQALCLMDAKIVGVMQMVDCGDADDKIISVAANDPGVNHYNNIEELPKHFFDELRHFFEEYKKLEKKMVVVEEFGDKTTALKIVQDAIDFYKETFRN
jgi:inorganic pyrophosphatase